MTQEAVSGGAILCAGRLYADLVFAGLERLPSLGTEVFSEGLTLHPGGGAANTAATLAALGAEGWLCATLPAAPFGEAVAATLRRLGVDLRLCRPAAPGTPPQVTAALPHAGDRAFVTYKGGPACPQITPSEAVQIGHLHIGELRTLEEQPELLSVARAAGWTVSLDCGWDDALMAQGAAMATLIAGVDLFLPNNDEWEALLDSGLSENCGPEVVVKCGADGAMARTDEGWQHAPVSPVTVLDPTGAGDAFVAGYLLGWRRGAPVMERLALGNLCGTQAVQVMGGAGGLHGRLPVPQTATARAVG